MPFSLKLKSLTLAAANWIVRAGRSYDSLASWDVAASGWPPEGVGDPVYIAILPVWATALPQTPEERAVMLQRKYDPDDASAWAFTPGLLEGELWLVQTKRIPTALN